ncbi:thymidine kinase [Candidatus Dependentiae bacterium]|nr:thymidine kinase [Candidatus Dependentiae bacterium]
MLISYISVCYTLLSNDQEHKARIELIEKKSHNSKDQRKHEKGSLTVICGSMCSGKSEELIRQVGRFIIAGFNVLVFKPSIDNREILKLNINPLSYISSRSGSWTKCIAVNSCEEILKTVLESNIDIVAIDEVMFFTDTKKFIDIIQQLLVEKKIIIIAGLDLNFRGEPFGAMPDLLAIADNVVKLTAICSLCQEDTYCITQRLIDGVPAHYNDPLIVVGASQYEPRCRKCHIIRKD